ncbi:MAG TPA: hypothetical protein VLS96_18475, partial [Nodosilinea sp.]|nr:hypothetical protein [Nodosilinea sp.]
GEKTGRNSKVLGSTSAVVVAGQTYIITTTLDHSGHDALLRTVIASIVEHLLTHDGFGADPEATPRPTAFLPLGL